MDADVIKHVLRCYIGIAIFIAGVLMAIGATIGALIVHFFGG